MSWTWEWGSLLSIQPKFELLRVGVRPLKRTDQQLLDQIDKIRFLLGAFSIRDIQVANTLVSWLAQNNITSRQFQDYVRIWFEINRLQAQGYFSPDRSPETGKYARSLERAIQDPIVRRYARNMRLAMTQFSYPGSKGG